jgi:cysteinyl-tRNA synthetase
MYSCGPTVYRYVHIGNLRTYLMADWLKRAARERGFTVTHIVNITDVGHMRSDLLDRGEDKMIAAALREGKSTAEIAAFYTDAFFEDLRRLGVQPADRYPKATEHVPEMIAIIEELLRRRHAYEVEGTVYFAVASFPAYGALSGNIGGDLREAVRGEADPRKRDPRDFALWKAAEPGRMVRWESPWGEGFPGWHIECSAMSTTYLGWPIDLHTGGVDNIFPHHEDEIAQCEAAYGEPFVRHWLHGQHLLVDGLKMAKSTGNAYTLTDLANRGFDPAALRYLCLGTHYRSRLNFTFPALRGAQRALERLRDRVREWDPVEPPAEEARPWRERFWDAVETDLGMPRAIATAWEMLRSPLAAGCRAALLLEFDRVLGLGLAEAREQAAIPRAVIDTVAARDVVRRAGDYERADLTRGKLRQLGFELRDGRDGSTIHPRTAAPVHGDDGFITGSGDVPDGSRTPATVGFSFILVARDNADEIERAAWSIRRECGGRDVEVIVVDNASLDGSTERLRSLASINPSVRFIAAEHNLGAAAARNAGLRASRGRFVILMDPSIELRDDITAPLAEALADDRVGVVGPFSLHSHDLRRFEEADSGEADAMQGYLFAFRRDRLRLVGFMDEKFRFYRNLDIDYSLAFRAAGLRIVSLPLPVIRHEHREWESLPEDERERRSKKNFYRFHHRWGSRTDLLLHTSHNK